MKVWKKNIEDNHYENSKSRKSPKENYLVIVCMYVYLTNTCFIFKSRCKVTGRGRGRKH